MIKSAFKGLLKRSGFHLFTNGSLPPGVDWLLDLKKLGLHASVTFFDVGANVGQTIFEVRASFPNLSIFAFEPFPVTFGTLREHTAHLKRYQYSSHEKGLARRWSVSRYPSRVHILND
jgi:hypothetical protein